jgi:fatty acid desaturase
VGGSTVGGAITPRTRAPRPGRGLLKYAADARQLGIVALYMGVLGCMYLVPACRNVALLALACALSFLNSVVIHNHLHQPVFRAAWANAGLRWVLSFGALYPASANIPSHNLVHHHFDDDGRPDWADPHRTHFRWNLLNLIHFPNVAGPATFEGVSRWAKGLGRDGFRRQYRNEMVFAFGATAMLLFFDFWTALFFVVVPQLYGARCILRINLIQHDGCDIASRWNHSRNFVGRAFNWVMCNNGYHTIHHNKAALHWSVLADAHREEAVPKMNPALDEPSMALYLLRTYVWPGRRAHLDRGAAAPATPAPAAAPLSEPHGAVG